ncbi:MAG: GMC family oxidoreductase N-terminal domain-containing protein [Rhodospirillaceae bacterium]
MNAAANAPTFDYVIVGAGAAGSVIAARLSELAGVRICVLEAGPADNHPMIHLPAGFIKMIFNPDYTWQFKTEPTELTGGRAVNVQQGRVVGGSGAINGMVYNRGQAADFDNWAQRGNTGWDYDSVLPYFKKSETWAGGDGNDADYHGTDGPTKVTEMDWFHPVCEAFIDGVESAGIPKNPDYNGKIQEGVGYFQRFIHKGRRCNSANAYLKPALKRRNIDLIRDAQATRILFEGKRAVGVEYRRQGALRRVMASNQVIVSSGAVNTPRLLQVSGLGAADVVAPLGVDVVRELPGVGENFQDHFSVRVVAKVKNSLTINELARGHHLVGQFARWLTGQPSILAIVPSLIHIFAKSDDALELPDLQGVFAPASFKAGYVGVLDDYPGMTCGFWPHRPESVGTIRAKTTDPDVYPEIRANYLSAEYDRRVLLAGMRLARKLLRTQPLSPYFEIETMPGDDVQTDDEWLDYAGQVGTSSWHLCGTAKMGPSSDPTAVVDPTLKVHGIDGLRVADASVMPAVTSANTDASTLMIAEKAADFIKAER